MQNNPQNLSAQAGIGVQAPERSKNNLKKMKKVAILSLFILVGCIKKAEKTEVRGNYNVELLFENDGCKVYRLLEDIYNTKNVEFNTILK